MEFEQYQLNNGARVLLVPRDGARSVATLIMYPVGSRYEPKKLQGASHYIEHLMFKGTKKRKTTLALTREIDRLGANYNAFTGKEYTGYYIKTDKKYIKTSIDILSDMLFHSVFDPKEMEREKGPIIEELSMHKDNPLMRIGDLLEELLYDGSVLGRDIGGTPKTVRGLERDTVLRFRDRFYGPNNMTIVIAGAIDEEVRPLIEEFVGRKDNTGKPKRQYEPAQFGSAKKKDRLRVEYKQADQVQLMLGFPGFAYGDPLNPAASVLHTILGGSMSSRLFIKVRERAGLAYSIASGLQKFRDSGYSYIQAGVEPKNVNKAIALVRKELERIKEKGVSKRELRDAKTHVRGGMGLSLENASAVANWYARQALFHESVETPAERLARIDAVSVDDVKRVAKKLFRWSDVRIAIVGDVEEESVEF